MNTVYSICYWLFMALSLAVIFCVALLVWLVTLPFDRNLRVLHLFSCFWGALYTYVNPLWRMRFERVAPVDRKRAYVIVANHQSLADVLILYRTWLPFKWVSKASVFKVPFLGWNMRLNGYVQLVRGDRESVAKMTGECLRWLQRGVSVLMFPEGSRSPDGELRPFKVGAFRIAREAGVPVLPIVLDGTADTLPKHGFVMQGRANVRLKILEPVNVSGFGSDEEAAEAVRGIMARTLLELRSPALPQHS